MREGPGGGAEGRTVGTRLRGSRLGAEAGRGRGRSRYRGDFSHPRWPWLPQGLEKKKGSSGDGELPARGRIAPEPQDVLLREGGGRAAG